MEKQMIQRPSLLCQPAAARPQRLAELNSAQSSVDPPHHPTIADQDSEDKATLTAD